MAERLAFRQYSGRLRGIARTRLRSIGTFFAGIASQFLRNWRRPSLFLIDDQPARIERDRDSALARYRKDRDTAALEATMRTLDQEELIAKAVHTDGPTPEEAMDSLRELPKLWDDAEPSGRKLLAEALLDRIDVLGTGKVQLHPSASAKAQGWDRAWNGARLVVMVGARGLEPTHRRHRC